MAFNERFDINEAREEARQAQIAKRNKMILSYSLLALAVIAVAIGGKFGWDYWQQCREEKAAEAKAAEEAEKRREQKARERAQKEREEREAKKEAERKAREEERERKRAERDAQREAERRARDAERAAREAEKEAQKQAKLERKELAEYAESLLQGIELKLEDHIAVEEEIRKNFKFDSDDPKWEKLMSGWRSKNAQVFFDAIPLDGYEPKGDELPSRQVMASKLDALSTQTFKLDVTVETDAKGIEPGIYTIDAEQGLVPLDDAHTVTDGKRIVGWHVDFVYGEGKKAFLMSGRKAKRLQGEFEDRMRSVTRDARHNKLSAETVAGMKARVADDFAQAVRVQISTPEPKQVESVQEQTKTDEKAAARDKRAERLKSMKENTIGGGGSGRYRRPNYNNNRR